MACNLHHIDYSNNEMLKGLNAIAFARFATVHTMYAKSETQLLAEKIATIKHNKKHKRCRKQKHTGNNFTTTII